MEEIDSLRRTFLKVATSAGGVLALGTGTTLAARTISYGDTVTGNISEDDPTDPKYDDYHTERIHFDGDSGDEVTITLDFVNADPWLRVVAPSGEELVDESTSEASPTISESGQHTIYPQAYPNEVPGEYTLTLTGGGDADGESTPDDSDDVSDSNDTVTELPTPDPAYAVETRALGASPTRAIFSMTIRPQPEALNDYELGSVSGLQLWVSGEDLRIARITPLPDETGDLFSASGSVLLATASLIGGPATAATATATSLATSSIELAQEIQEHNLEQAEGTKSAVFTGDPFGGTGFLSDTVKYMIEIESTAGPITEDDSELGADWGNAVGFSYEADPPQPPSSTEIPTKTYVPDMEGDLVDDEPFADHE